jgi:hypothetical protein
MGVNIRDIVYRGKRGRAWWECWIILLILHAEHPSLGGGMGVFYNPCMIILATSQE